VEHSPSWEANRSSASQESLHTLWNWRCITAFTTARHPSPLRARSIQTMPRHPTSWRPIL